MPLGTKSKKDTKAKVSSKTVSVSAIARHRDDFNCNHALVVGPDFPGDGTVLSQEIEKDKEQNSEKGRTITVIKINDLARLIRLRPLKRIGPLEIRELFKTCKMPDDCKQWVDKLEENDVEIPKYKELLEVIYERQNKRPGESVEFGAIALALESKGIEYSREKIINICKSLEGMAYECIRCRNNSSVELRQKPEIVMTRIKTETSQYPENETNKTFLGEFIRDN